MKTAKRIALLQMSIALVAAVFWAVFADARSGLAALVGGSIAVTLTIYAAVKTFAAPAADAGRAVTNFYRAEVRKLILAAVLFAAAVRFFGDVFAPVIVTFALTLPVYWFALLWDTNDG
ncbi:ATP synthase I chain [Fontimonas thermophila]|uniref:ATP synthase I chain n=1 Tax=Fontimonas thermophila TaxID=1076937 RepID=A0A1I2JUQ8_9GAMM|nr:ATP synthase subunit I [Fontimonas thermophila]SFF56546.1 ATP synthase I chain [Fontimonas thermophila]